MSLRGWAPGKEVSDPRGMWSAYAQKDAGHASRGIYAQNVRFAPGIVRTRPGSDSVTAPSPIVGKIVKGLKLGNLGTGWRYFYLLGTQLRYGLLQSGAISCPTPFDYLNPVPTYALPADPSSPTDPSGTLKLFNDTVSLTPYTITVAIYNGFAYIALADKQGNGVAPVVISDGSGIVDVAFSNYTQYRSGINFGGGFGMSFTALSAGNCSAGTASYALVLKTATGFLSAPMVQTAPNFASPSKIQATITIPAHTYIYGNVTAFLLKTPTSNRNKWFWIPNDPNTGSIGSVPVTSTAGSSATLTFVVNISDADMEANLDEATDQWLVLQQSQFPTFKGPFSPQFVVLYGKRMCYGVDNNLYVSDINNPQYVTADQHLVQSPKQLKLGAAFVVPGSADLFLTGTKWLGRVTDNGDVPSTWAPPILISDTIGAPFPGCVCSRTAGGYAWIVANSGVYLFDGTLGQKPVTYLIPDQWARVNWSAAYCIETEDDILNRLLYVAVPLDGATEVNGVFVIDYSYGFGFDQVDISLDLYDYNPVYSLAVGPDEVGADRLWLGSNAGHLLQLHSNYTGSQSDAGGPITSIWESGLIRNPGDFASRMLRVGGLDLWMRGGGGLTTTISGLDKVRNVSPILLSAAGVPSGLAPTPGIMYHEKFDFAKVENYSIRFQVNTWFELSGFTVYSKPDLYNR
jgi:hypothetical protein